MSNQGVAEQHSPAEVTARKGTDVPKGRFDGEIAAGDYTCPMHPEVRRPNPGSCPICGMALERRNVSAVQEENSELTDISRRFWGSVGLTIPLLISAMAQSLDSHPLEHFASARFWTWFEFTLATPVVLWGGWPFFVRFWQIGRAHV